MGFKGDEGNQGRAGDPGGNVRNSINCKTRTRDVSNFITT